MSARARDFALTLWSARAPIGAALLGWFAVGVIAVGRLRGSGVLVGDGLGLFLLIFSYTWWRRRRWSDSPEDGSGIAPAYAWIGVGIVPSFYVAVAMFDQGSDSGWILGVIVVVLLIASTAIALGLTTDSRRQQRPRSALALARPPAAGHEADLRLLGDVCEHLPPGNDTDYGPEAKALPGTFRSA